MSRTRKIWETYGETDPYYAVVTLDQNRSKNIDNAAKDEFFRGGHEHVDRVWRLIEQHFTSEFSPRKAVDFGCGVGRITLPLAGRSGEVIGVDLSENMLAEARENCRDQQIANANFIQTDSFLADRISVDFVHAFIVFQHIRPKHGLQIVRKMLGDLSEGGIGALHFSYDERASIFERLRYRIYEYVPLVYRIRQALSGRRYSPIIPKHVYDMNVVLRELHDANCHEVVARFSDHGLLGVLLIFRKSELPSV